MRNTPITAKIKRTTKGGITDPMLNVGSVVKMGRIPESSPAKMGPGTNKEADKRRAERVAAEKKKQEKANYLAAKQRQEKGTYVGHLGHSQKKNDPGIISAYEKKHPYSTSEFSKEEIDAAQDKFDADMLTYRSRPSTDNVFDKEIERRKTAPKPDAPKPSKGNKLGAPKGKAGSAERKAEYDARNWKYDDTIAGYGKKGSKQDVGKKAQEMKVKAPKTELKTVAPDTRALSTKTITAPPSAKDAKQARKNQRKEQRAERRASRDGKTAAGAILSKLGKAMGDTSKASENKQLRKRKGKGGKSF